MIDRLTYCSRHVTGMAKKQACIFGVFKLPRLKKSLVLDAYMGLTVVTYSKHHVCSQASSYNQPHTSKYIKCLYRGTEEERENLLSPPCPEQN